MFEPVKGNPILAALMMLTASSLIGMTTILAKMLGQGFDGESSHPLHVNTISIIKDPNATLE